MNKSFKIDCLNLRSELKLGLFTSQDKGMFGQILYKMSIFISTEEFGDTSGSLGCAMKNVFHVFGKRGRGKISL